MVIVEIYEELSGIRYSPGAMVPSIPSIPDSIDDLGRVE